MCVWDRQEGDTLLGEVTATHDATTYGGTVTGIPGPAPDMPLIGGSSSEQGRPITIIKIYETIKKGTTTIEYIPEGTYTTEKNCRYIDIQNETPEWSLTNWWMSTSRDPYTGWKTGAREDYVKRSPTAKGSSNGGIKIVKEPYTTLYVYLTRTEEEDTEEIKMELYESEITHRYVMSNVTELKEQDKTMKFKWDSLDDRCSDSHQEYNAEEDGIHPNPVYTIFNPKSHRPSIRLVAFIVFM